MVTKKDFNKIAEIIERNIPQGPFVLADDLVKDLADYFESVNPNFHRGKFILRSTGKNERHKDGVFFL